MPKHIQLPDGSIGEFPDDMEDSAIEGVLQKQFGHKAEAATSRPAGLPAGANLPGFPSAPSPITPRVIRNGERLTRAFGEDPFTNANAITVPLKHIGGAITGLAQTALHPYDSLVKPTVDAVKATRDSIRSGAPAVEIANHAMDAIPVVGPWARNVENEAATSGAIPALLGLGTDAVAPKVIAEGVGATLQGAGKIAKLGASSPESLKLAATRKLAPGNSGEVMNKALKPGVQYGADTSALFEDTLKPILATGKKVGGVSDLVDATDAAREANNQGYQNLVAPYRPAPGGIGPVRPGMIDANPIANAQLRSIPTMDLVEKPSVTSPGGMRTTPGIVDKTKEVAGNYRRMLSLPVLDEVRQDANGKLNAFYAKTGGDQAAALSSPETARVKAVGDTSRELLYKRLGEDAGIDPEGIADNQRMYGRLSQLGDIAGKRETVFGRHDPVSLAEKVAMGHGPVADVWNFAKQKALRSLTDSDALVRSAVDRYENPDATPLVVGDNPYQKTLNKLGVGVSGAGTQLRRLSPFAPIVVSR